jgi:hypothetical protein
MTPEKLEAVAGLVEDHDLTVRRVTRGAVMPGTEMQDELRKWAQWIRENADEH